VFGRFREIVDWRFVLSAAFLILVVQLGFNSWSDSQHNDRLVQQLEHVQADAAAERQQASKERAVLVEGQRRLRADYQKLLDYLEGEGIEVPPNLSRTVTLGGSGDNDNDDDDGDTTRIEVRPQTGSTSTPPSSSSSPPSSSNEPEEDGPDVDLPDTELPPVAGEATDTAKDIIGGLPGIGDVQ
jgi:hypothetical protein